MAYSDHSDEFEVLASCSNQLRHLASDYHDGEEVFPRVARAISDVLEWYGYDRGSIELFFGTIHNNALENADEEA